EVFAPFAALVIAAQLSGKANAMTAFWSASFFYLRLAHAIVYWAGLPYLRTVLFTLAFITEVGIFWEVVK
ncbi:MAG TPA: MAPEG family protein, partial [Candidatus Acidoferrum sp.]|nr:MAPEG family protein [Candidatus Acidoferrum sp.]